jgi:hypothetical protein
MKTYLFCISNETESAAPPPPPLKPFTAQRKVSPVQHSLKQQAVAKSEDLYEQVQSQYKAGENVQFPGSELLTLNSAISLNEEDVGEVAGGDLKHACKLTFPVIY